MSKLMSSAQAINALKFNDDEDEELALKPIRWINIIFLPFHPVWEFLVLIMVLIKCYLGPLTSVYPIHCQNMDDNDLLYPLKFCYDYISDTVYAADTFLRIVHRQVEEEATRREFLPKKLHLVVLDLLALVPFFSLWTVENCNRGKFFPNILAFSETLLCYRVVEYFSLTTTHNAWKLLVGYLIMLFLYINILCCLLLLLTTQGFCEDCSNGNYDWRSSVMQRLNVTATDDLSMHLFGTCLVMAYTIQKMIDFAQPNTQLEMIFAIIAVMSGYLIMNFSVIPKLFIESSLKLKQKCMFHIHVLKIIHETKRRNPSAAAHKKVKKFYGIVWQERGGLTAMPEMIGDLPRHLTTTIRQDLAWTVFYHSPSLRHTTTPFKRWLSERVVLNYKLPGEKFFLGSQCHTHLYCIKSGIVQFYSEEDTVSPILSVTSGTVFGDICFILPHLSRQVRVNCLTYCEVFFIPRRAILRAMHRFTEDRRNIIALAKERIKHAKTLYNLKENIKGLDRVEDEGVAWIKKRWWNINSTINNLNKICLDHSGPCKLQAEETYYHCPKYLGQLVLCTDVELLTNSILLNERFPWVLSPNSTVGVVWNHIVIVTTFLALIGLPPVIWTLKVNETGPIWFLYLKVLIDFVYIADVLIALTTAVQRKRELTTNIMEILFERCKSIYFILDVLSTPWIEHFLLLTNLGDYYYVAQFNRLLKAYLLFGIRYKKSWRNERDPLYYVIIKIIVIYFLYGYVCAYLMSVFVRFIPELTPRAFFGDIYAFKNYTDLENSTSIVTGWLYQRAFSDYPPLNNADITAALIISCLFLLMIIYTKIKFLSSLYLKNRAKLNYYFFVKNLKKHFIDNRINPLLLKRLEKYLICHWKYFLGWDILYPPTIKKLPTDIYYKLHGNIAEKIIGESVFFKGASPSLIREMARDANFLLLPATSNLISLGIHAKNVTWLVNGVLIKMIYDDNGEEIRRLTYPGEVLTLMSVVLQKPSTKSYRALTECEILYISKVHFLRILKRYPNEKALIDTCLQNSQKELEDLNDLYMEQHRASIKQRRKQIFMGNLEEDCTLMETNGRIKTCKDLWRSYRTNPNSKITFVWMTFRMIVAILEIIASGMQGGSGFHIAYFMIFGFLCEGVTCCDILYKFFLPYYDERGIVISSAKKCMLHYMARGFFFDVISALPKFVIFKNIFGEIKQSTVIQMHTLTLAVCHFYIVTGYFDYLADTPTVKVPLIMVIKWQIFILLTMICSAAYLTPRCVDITWDVDTDQTRDGVSLKMKKVKTCWLPKYLDVKDPENVTTSELHFIYGYSLILTQCGFLNFNSGKFYVAEGKTGIIVWFCIINAIFWYIQCLSQTHLFIFHNEEFGGFQQSINQLYRFLKEERVPQKSIDLSIDYFNYVWARTNGIDVHTLMNERMGAVFKQDLSYSYFKRTFGALDNLLKGGKPLEKLLSSNSSQIHFLPGQDILREMELAPSVYVIHRGTVLVFINGVKRALLTKGSIFGELDDHIVRPSRITVRSIDYVDVLRLPIKEFQDIIDDDIRQTIREHSTSKNDYIAVKPPIEVNSYNAIEYIMFHKQKIIKLPWMKNPVYLDDSSWYKRWLFLTWLVGPIGTTAMVLLIYAMPHSTGLTVSKSMIAFDLLHLMYMISEFYAMKLTVVDNVLMKQYKTLKSLMGFRIWLDIISITFPLLTIVTDALFFQFARLLRFHTIFLFYRHFCTSFKANKCTALLLKIVMLILLLHALTCGWLYVACGYRYDYPVDLPKLPNQTSFINPKQWLHPYLRRRGCLRRFHNKTVSTFMTPNTWHADYLLALSYVIVLHTHLNMNELVPLTLSEVYYRVFMTIILYLVDIWLASVCIGFMYNIYRQQGTYDYNVLMLLKYLKQAGISDILLHSVKKYTAMLWTRQRGCWLPEITNMAPECLREDILSSLYVHHLEGLPIFQNLPPYFLRQLSAKLRRVVVFPGNTIIQEGDIFPCIYFVHEGELEKLCTDASGENRLITVVGSNSYFGVVPGLFPELPFKYTYRSRTVVDLVYLLYDDWKDLLECYPDLKASLYEEASKLKKRL